MALRQMSEVFANLTDFDVPAGLFNILVGKFKTKFPYLQRLKLLGEMKDINKVTTAPECFPNLQVIEVSLPFDYYNQYKSSDLVFTHPLPTVKELSITLEEISDDGFVDADLQLVKDWLSKFPSLTKAKISLEKSVRNYPLTDSPDRYTQLHDLFKSIDFGVPLDLSFTADGRVPYPNYVDPDEVPEDEIDLDDLAPYFEYYERPFIYFNHTHGFSTERFVYKYAMPGKKFEHKINLDLEM
uniref:F-box domain-containing protein n=1 Tax=Panagrellus redivivus TaxID=6233 RepID=A0A7E4VB08_PANRE